MSSSPNPTVISLDYDGTCTTDLAAWRKAAQAWKDAGFIVYVVTMRYPAEQNLVGDSMDAQLLAIVDRVIFTRRRAKREFLREQGIFVSIWIEDTPEAVFLDAEEIWPRVTPPGEVVVANDPATHPQKPVVDISWVVRRWNKMQSNLARLQGQTNQSGCQTADRGGSLCP